MDVTVRSMRSGEFRRSWTGVGRRGAVTVRADLGDATGEVVIGYVTPRRLGTAVVRNRLRRRARPVIADAAAAGRIEPGFYMVSFGQDAPDDHEAFTTTLLAAFSAATRRR
jgi:RNase P protein component